MRSPSRATKLSAAARRTRHSGARGPRRLRESFRLRLAGACRDFPEVEGLVLTWRGLVAAFRYRLAEAVAWCAGRSLLHSPALDPEAAENPYSGWGERSQRVALQRRSALPRT